jgi:hypothetical protein
MSIVKFLGREYRKHFDKDHYNSFNSCISFYYTDNILVLFDGEIILTLDVSLNELVNETSQNIVQRKLDENQELILKKIAEEITRLSNIISFTKDEFDKVLIFV